jgi:hypothetical protein
VLVWFSNPDDDPRTRGGLEYPVRRSEARRLSKAEYDRGLEENRRRRAAGLPPYMIVTTLAGPVVGTPFFTAGADEFYAHLLPIIREEFERFVLANWQPGGVLEAPPARVRLR